MEKVKKIFSDPNTLKIVMFATLIALKGISILGGHRTEGEVIG